MEVQTVVDVEKVAKVEPVDPTTWEDYAIVTPLETGMAKGVPLERFDTPGQRTVNRTADATKYGKAFVIGTPPGNFTVLPLVESNGPLVIVPVGTEPYIDGVVVLFM